MRTNIPHDGKMLLKIFGGWRGNLPFIDVFDNTSIAKMSSSKLGKLITEFNSHFHFSLIPLYDMDHTQGTRFRLLVTPKISCMEQKEEWITTEDLHEMRLFLVGFFAGMEK